MVALSAATASSHPMPNTAVVLRLDQNGIDAELTLPIIELRVGWQKPVPADAVKAVQEYGHDLQAYVLDHFRPVAPDGRPWTVTVVDVIPVREIQPDIRLDLRLTPPAGAPADRLTLNCDVITHQLVTHSAILTIASDWRNGILNGQPPLLVDTFRDTHKSVEIDRSGGSWFHGMASVSKLGMRHIAEGTDHLLFLLALLLPAPLVASGWKWGRFAGTKTAIVRIAKIVTAFTIGHSVTLIFGAMGWVHVYEPIVESAIAVSIFVSAVHALVPILRGKEIYIAGGFGLVHGLAFAATLTEFGFDSKTMAASMFAFNVGIEIVQLIVIAVTMPWLILLSETPLYTPFRIGGATLTGVAAVAWFVERTFDWSNPIGTRVERVAAHPWFVVGGLATFASLSWLLFGAKNGPVDSIAPAQPLAPSTTAS